MAFVIKNPPEFTTEVEQWNQETLADGAEMAKVPEALLNNEVYLKTQIERQEEQIGKQRGVTEVPLAADGWTGDSAPYEQTVMVEGATEEGDAVLVRNLKDGASMEEQKAYNKAFGIIASGTASLGNGMATFKVYKKPEATITVGLKGV